MIPCWKLPKNWKKRHSPILILWSASCIPTWTFTAASFIALWASPPISSPCYLHWAVCPAGSASGRKCAGKSSPLPVPARSMWAKSPGSSSSCRTETDYKPIKNHRKGGRLVAFFVHFAYCMLPEVSRLRAAFGELFLKYQV